MIQGKCYSFSNPTKSSTSGNLIPAATGGPIWKEGSYVHEMEGGRGILFMDPSRRNGEEEDGPGACCSIVFEKEHMFDKAVTPSDVGKLNRLVIPKQHAEKYFPLDSSNCDKGLHLNFEDRAGKPWRFRYSYWNSSQSYVMTKGWSRFVKEMKLHAGDIVSFQRGVGDLGKDRLFIDWRRRNRSPEPHPMSRSLCPSHLSFGHSVPWDLPAPKDYLWFSQTSDDGSSHRHRYGLSGPVGRIYDYGYGYGRGETLVEESTSNYRRGGRMDAQGRFGDGVPIYESVPLAQVKADTTTKMFRLFGVNMECAASDSIGDDDNLQAPLVPDIMLCDGVPVTASTEFPSKGKASMSLDLDI